VANPFPDDPVFKGNYAPIVMECEATDLPVIGELPKELAGTLYRNGPNPQYAPRDRQHHWFIGDGMVHAFHIEDGKVGYRNRWVRTPKWQAEHQAGRALFGSFGNPMTTDPSVLGQDDGVANTNIVWHGRRLMALEEAHRPFALDPTTLASLGYCDLDPRLGRFTAHPKIDPVTGELVFFAYSAGGPLTLTMAFGTIDVGGRLTRFETFRAPYSSMVHDFIVTREHVLFPVLPLTGSMERAKSGKPVFAWEPQKGSHVGVMRRDGTAAAMRWFHSEACYVFHVLNAWDEKACIIADVMQYEAAPLFPSADGKPGDPDKTQAHLCRWSFDLSSNSDAFTRQYIDDLSAEFPRLDERFAGSPNRHGYYACRKNGDSGAEMFDCLAHIDLAAGRRTLHELPRGDAISEPIFVPRGRDAAEGDGRLLAVAYRGPERRSDLLIFDAQALDRAPIATVGLSHRIPFGFHGNWKPTD